MDGQGLDKHKDTENQEQHRTRVIPLFISHWCVLLSSPLLPSKEFGQLCNLGLVFLIHLSSVAVIWHGIIFFQSFFKVRILGYFLNSLGEFV